MGPAANLEVFLSDMFRTRVSRALDIFGFEVRRRRPAGPRPWDKQFMTWVEEARHQDRDVNDVADERWGDVRHLIGKYYLPHIRENATVLELGPGTGRITRHIIDRCGQVILVDFSQVVIDWIGGYLRAKGHSNFATHRVDDCHLRTIADASVDVAISDGVFHHIDLEDVHRYLSAFKRVLVPGGIVVVNFVNIMAAEGYRKFRIHADARDDRDVFRWHHPAAVAQLCGGLGFVQVELGQERVLAGDFVCYSTCRKPINSS